ncbi:MAG: hypothetical protein JSS27_11035 [Planctomycetes bacterium]|nr:hypothetical protein [Planctomycetota bacterium]
MRRDAASTWEPSEQQVAQVEQERMRAALKPFLNPKLRNMILGAKQALEQVIDEQTPDQLLRAGFDAAALEKAKSMLTSFRQFIEDNKDEIEALQVLYSQPYRAGLRFRHVKELAAKLNQPPFFVDPARPESLSRLWQAFELVDAASSPVIVDAASSRIQDQQLKQQVDAASSRIENPPDPASSRIQNQQLKRQDAASTTSRKLMLVDVIALVRHAIHPDTPLAPVGMTVEQRYQTWLSEKQSAGVTFTADQRRWLDAIKDHIASSLAIEQDDLEEVPFNTIGGLGRAYELFGDKLSGILDELNLRLAA